MGRHFTLSMRSVLINTSQWITASYTRERSFALIINTPLIWRRGGAARGAALPSPSIVSRRRVRISTSRYILASIRRLRLKRSEQRCETKPHLERGRRKRERSLFLRPLSKVTSHEASTTPLSLSPRLRAPRMRRRAHRGMPLPPHQPRARTISPRRAMSQHPSSLSTDA